MSKYSYNDYYFGTTSDTGNILGVNLIARPPGLKLEDWYNFARSLIPLFKTSETELLRKHNTELVDRLQTVEDWATEEKMEALKKKWKH